MLRVALSLVSNRFDVEPEGWHRHLTKKGDGPHARRAPVYGATLPAIPALGTPAGELVPNSELFK